jgi:lipopolysaccharide transport system permease protein
MSQTPQTHDRRIFSLVSFQEMLEVVRLRRVWVLMGNQDIRLRYKRSVIGPFWITLTLAAWVAGISILYSQILNAPFREYLVYLTCGLLAWNFISAIINEGNGSLVDNAAHIQSARIPLSVFPARVVYRNYIVVLHNAVVVALVLLYSRAEIGLTALLAMPGLLMVGLCLFFAISITGVLCARYPDLKQVISSLMQMGFFLTPILWQPGMAGRSSFALNANPLYHLIELIRAPLLGTTPSTYSFVFVFCMLIALGLGALFAWSVARRRVFYWV